ncbi:MAG: type IV pilus assembly protein PilM [Planctomycetaceae bacterium]|nr:type IV pilus assembly protein PilM [Planctomycetaceae bacterium]
MASGAVWGIDVGQCALKALRCRVHETDSRKVIADAFDYIEYPKILSQPGSDPTELIGEALKQFLSRNTVVGDRVAISVSGQAGLARFIKLPPVEAKKIPNMVRYEARQQIPFDLNDVIWDYQRMGVGNEEEGFALEIEVGLFAMKREAVFRALEPFDKAGIEVDLVQLTPLVLYNFLLFDQLKDLPPADEYDPENPPESVVLISLGTDATDLVITNGFRVWQRSIPLGGSHFTRALTKELKLTFAKAEHLKRNAMAASDPKAVFQAMKPVFGDLLTELQRSIGYFSNLNRSAKLSRVIALGNTMKLPGLRRYLSQSLGFEIEKIEAFPSLTGSQVVAAPSFQENLLSFPVSYGLALQGLNRGGVHTNLLPKEILNDRMIRRKKPWALTAVALFLLGCAVSFAAYSLALGTVDVAAWKTAENDANQVISEAGRLKQEADRAVAQFKETEQIGQHLVGNVEGRLRWLELLKAVNVCLPTGEDRQPTDKDSVAERIALRRELHVTNLECQYLEDVGAWYGKVKRWDEASAQAAAKAAKSADPNHPPAPEPKGPGWLVQLRGYHFHNADRTNNGAQYVYRTLIENLRNGKVSLPGVDPKTMEETSMAELGISFPILINPTGIVVEDLPDPNYVSESATRSDRSTGGAASGRFNEPAAGAIRLHRFDFVVQFVWQPKTPSARLDVKKSKESQTAAKQDSQP